MLRASRWLLTAAVVMLLCSVTVHAQITFDAAASSNGNGASSLTFALTVAVNSNRALAVGCSQTGASTDHTITGITYAAVAMAQVATIGSASGDNSRVDIWKLAAPATGANNVVVTFNSSSDGFFSCGAESWYSVDQTNIFRTASTNTNGTTAVTSDTLTPTSLVGDVVLDFIGWRYVGQGTITIGGSQTERVTVSRAATCCEFKGSSKAGAAGTTTMTWSWATAGWTSDSYVAAAMIPFSSGPNTGSKSQLGNGR